METLVVVIGLVAMAAIGATLLAYRDRRRAKAIHRLLQARLTRKQQCSAQDLAAYFLLAHEQEIARRFRSRLATALEVDECSIHPEDDLHKDYQLDVINPFLLAAIASEFTHDPDASGSQQVLLFRNDATKFRDFVRAIAQRSKTV